MLEERLGIPCAGVVPWVGDLGIDEEDDYALPPAPRAWPDEHGPARRLRVALVELPFLSNATDAAALAAEPSVALRRVASADGLAGADVALLPGSKETAADLRVLRERGLERALLEHARTRPLLGICGGAQMLGRRIDDPLGVEQGGSLEGLGLLPLTTELAPRKTTVRVRGALAGPLFGQPLAPGAFAGYEIHLGASRRDGGAPFAHVRDGAGPPREDGAVSPDGLVAGTSVHGLFDDDAFRHAALAALRARAGLAPATNLRCWHAEREARYDRLAAIWRAALDMPLLARIAGLAVPV